MTESPCISIYILMDYFKLLVLTQEVTSVYLTLTETSGQTIFLLIIINLVQFRVLYPISVISMKFN